MTYMIRVMFSSWLIKRKAGEILHRRQSSVGQVKSIKILVVEGEKDFTLSTQLDDESTIRILEVCLKKLKDRTSLKVVPILGKESIYDQRKKKWSRSSFSSI